jgi:integrase
VTEVAGGGHAAQDATVADLINQWFEMAKPELSPTTIRGYQRAINAYILPTLGKVHLARLNTAQIDRLYTQLRQSGGSGGRPLAPATVRQVHAILRRALNQGVKWDWLSVNPAQHASPPRIRRPQHDPPAPEDVMRLIDEAAKDDPDLGCLLHVAATTGARRGELCGLRWRNVDLDAQTMTISRSVVEGGKGVAIEKDTKTHAARHIALDADTAAVLTAHRHRMAERSLACGAPLDDDAFVFSSSTDGSVSLQPNDVTKDFIRVRGRIGLDSVRLHDLRHFAATRLLAAGVPVRTVSGRLGHANAATTLGVYAHFIEASDRDAAEALGAVLASGRHPTEPPSKVVEGGTITSIRPKRQP